MVPVSLLPRERDPDSWRLWLREGMLAWRRGWLSWAPLQITATLVMVALLTHFPALGVVIGAAMGPLFGIHLAAVEGLARGRTGILSVAGAMIEDARTHTAPYLRSFMWRLLFLSLLLTFQGPADVPEHLRLLFAFMQVAFLWGIGHVGRVTGIVGFYPWLAWKHRMAPRDAFLLNQQARAKNANALDRLNAVFLALAVLAMALPFLVLIIEPFLAATLRAAYADIFNQDPGVQAVEESRQTASPRLAAASTQASHRP